MWRIGLLLAATAAMAQAPAFQPVGTMSELMIRIIYPASDAIFYVERVPPKTEVDWNVLRGQALTLAESGNLLLMPSRLRDQGNWIKDSKMLVDAGAAAYKAALAKDMNGVLAVNDQLYAACVTCHQQYRADYPKRPAAQ